MHSHIFGPVPSRRLGRSLGIDLVPFKTCTYDCIYCQLGRTTQKTTERKEWVPLGEVLNQLQNKLSTRPDYITISGSGEPTLYSRIGELIVAIKDITELPVAVLTNGSLFWDSEVRRGLMRADLVVPSLDAPDERLFRYVNRPHKEISFNRMVEGLGEFRTSYSGQYWLEVFLLSGISDLSAEIEKMAGIVRKIKPDRVQLNTVTRPPAEDFAAPVSKEQMKRFTAMFGDGAEVIADYRGTHQKDEFIGRREDIVTLLRRRPCTIQDISEGLGLHRNEVVKYIQELSEQGVIDSELRVSRLYYKMSSLGL